MHHRLVWIAVIVLCVAPLALGGKFNETLSVGDAAPAWEKLPGVDGKEHSLAELADKEIVVVAFTCNSCPVAVDYEDRIIALAKKHAAGGRVAVVAINCNTVKADLLDAMKERAEKKQFPFQYLHDASQNVGKSYGAVFTPEFYVLNRERKILYMGAFDDNSNLDQVKRHYLEEAVAAALEGKSPDAKESLARGCRIRYKAERK